MLEHWGSNVTTLSPGGKYVLYFDENNGHWFTYRVADGVRANLTEKLPVKFQQENNTPDLPGPYGTGGWTANDTSVLLYDQFDIWEVKPDGTGARMITDGEGRKQAAGRSATARSTRRSASSRPTSRCCSPRPTTTRARPGSTARRSAAPPAPEKIVMLDKAFGARRPRPKKADTVVFTLSRFEEFPNLWVERHDLQGHEEGVERQPAAGASSSGASRS